MALILYSYRIFHSGQLHSTTSVIWSPNSICLTRIDHKRTSLFQMSSQLLTDEDCLQILQNYHQTTTDFEIVATEWSQSSANVEGFMGDHYILKISYKSPSRTGTQNFFIKTQPTRNESQQEVSEVINVYEKETFFYDFLLKEYEKCGLVNDFCPRNYFCKDARTLVMEDLREDGYALRKRKEFYEEDDCKVALKALARYHANGMIYEEIRTKETGRTFRLEEEYPRMFGEVLYSKGFGLEYLESTRKCLLKIAELLPESEEWKESFCGKLRGFDYVTRFYAKCPGRKACGHGDLWCNNMLFHPEGSCKLIDFQVLRYYYPAFDALLLVYLNTLRKFRNEHLEELLGFYYETLSTILQEARLVPEEILSKEEFSKSCEELHGLAVFQAITGRSLTHLPMDFTTENLGQVDLQDIWVKDRAKYVYEGCLKDELYKEILLGDIYDLNKLI